MGFTITSEMQSIWVPLPFSEGELGSLGYRYTHEKLRWNPTIDEYCRYISSKRTHFQVPAVILPSNPYPLGSMYEKFYLD